MFKGSVVVVAHNSGACVENCLQALCPESDWEILLIDNASSDTTLGRASRFSGRVRIIANAENRGFAGAVNQAVELSAAGIIVAMNPDVEPERGALDVLAQALGEGRTGAAGGMLLDDQGQPQRGFLVRRFPTLGSALCEVLLLNRLWPSNPWNARYRCLDLDCRRGQTVDQPAGAALAFRRDAWQQTGGLDESFYPVWFEDVDFCFRLRQQGWQIVYCPQAAFRHRGAHSVSRLSLSERQSYWYGNLLRYFRKHHRPASAALLRAGIMAGMILRVLAALAGGAPDACSRREAIQAYMLVMWRYAIRSALRPTAVLPPAPVGIRTKQPRA